MKRTRIDNSDYANEQYFEDWGASPQLTDAAHIAEDTAPVCVLDTDCNDMQSGTGPFGSVIIQPDDPVEAGHHRHKCDKCSTAWKHSDDNKGNEAAHTCRCGEVQWNKYYPPLRDFGEALDDEGE